MDTASPVPLEPRPADLNDLATPNPHNPAHQLAWMTQQLHRANLQGATLTLEPGNLEHQGPATLIVTYTAADSRDPNPNPRRISLTARRPIGPYPTHDINALKIDLRNTLLHGVYAHELDENLLWDGQRLNDPHTDPTRWHCTNCGGVGPTRHEGNTYICPGCSHINHPPKGQTAQEPEAPGAVLGSSQRAQEAQLSTLAVLVAAVEREAARDGVVFVDADAAREAEEAYDAALEGLRAELRCRRQLVHADPLVQWVREYGDMRAQAKNEGECGSNVDADLIEARAELVRDEIAATIRATQGQIRHVVSSHGKLRAQLIATGAFSDPAADRIVAAAAVLPTCPSDCPQHGRWPVVIPTPYADTQLRIDHIGPDGYIPVTVVKGGETLQAPINAHGAARAAEALVAAAAPPAQAPVLTAGELARLFHETYEDLGASPRAGQEVRRADPARYRVHIGGRRVNNDLTIRRQREALSFLLGYIHGSDGHEGPAGECAQDGCAEAIAALNEPVTVTMAAPEQAPKPDFVLPGQIWRSDANPTHRVKIEATAGHGPNALAQPVDPKGRPEGDWIHVKMDGPRAILGYTRDLEAEQRDAERDA